MNKCIYCSSTGTEASPLYHGPVWDDPFARKPRYADYCYCEDCSNGHMSLKHRYFAMCNVCDREFTEHGETTVVEDEGQDECLSCKRERLEVAGATCKVCGHTADGYYCIGLCRLCECGCLLNRE